MFRSIHIIRDSVRTWCLCLLVLFCSAGGAPGVRAEDDQYTRADKFKALFIYNFIQYIQWPDSDTSGDFSIGILGDTSVAEPLREIARRRTVGDRKLIIEPVKEIEALGACRILFVAGSKKDQLEEIRQQAEDKHILTIGDTEEFAHQGVAINFTLVGEKLRFEIDCGAIERAGLKVSSQLLKLGILVHEEERGEK